MCAESLDVKTVFCNALEKETPGQRSRYLDEICAGHPTIRTEVEDLLALHNNAGKFLDTPILESSVTPGISLLSETPGTSIGRYKLLEKIGEGGMAVVYMAEQERPLRRKVALKVIKLGMDTRQVIARFEAERQALAMMDHPSISKVHDAGATETGRPYFVMELVQGISITDYCDQNNLNTKDRLTLFIQVCHAVQHAHQKGIIHRDLKPSNVLVTLHDGTPVPKVIDFGIAKATNQRLTEKTLFTRYAHVIGTPAYMSPEQAELSDLDIDTRSDIYSLGVLMYELLTGTTPFSEEELRRAGYVEMTRIIREQEPLRPSTRLTQLKAPDKSTAPKPQSKIDPDLDWIVMKSLEKDRTRRYETATSLGLDVQRHLDSEPVLARAPSATYRLRKFLYRHRVPTAALLGVAVVIVAVGIILSLWQQDRLQLLEAEVLHIEAETLQHGNLLSQCREFLARGERKVALERVESILDSAHVGPEARLLRAGILVEDRLYDAAAAALNNLLDERPEITGAAHALLARILWESPSPDAEKRAKVDEHLRQAEAMLPEKAEAYFLRAMTAMTIKEELDMLDQALRLDPTHYESYRLRAFIYSASRKYGEMKEDASVMVALRPQDSLGYSLRAAAQFRLEKCDRAVGDYDIALGLTASGTPEYLELQAQRCDTLIRMGQFDRVIKDAQTCLQTASEALTLEFRVFCAMTAQGRYPDASALYERVCTSNTSAQSKFRDWSGKYVFDALAEDRPWYPGAEEPKGVAFQDLRQAQQTYRTLSGKARRVVTDAFTAHYSPNGTKLAFSTGFHGYSGVAVMDTKTGQTDLLMVPGKDPQWSPDGHHLVFVRDCNVLPVPELANAERMNQHRLNEDEEVWIMKADGTEPRRLAFGSDPCWSRDPNHIYYYSSRDGMLYKTNWLDTDDIPQPIRTKGLPALSPDRESMAHFEGTSIKVRDLASESVLAQCKLPFKPQGKTWSRDGRELCFGASVFGESLWVYSLDEGTFRNVLPGPTRPTSVAPDGTKLVFNIKPPYFEIWEADLDSDISMLASLGPGKTFEECRQEQLALHMQRIKADPNNAHNYFLRAQHYDALGERQRAQADMRAWSALVARGALADSHSSVTRRVINLPYDYQLVFSAERPTNTNSMMSIALGQKGRSTMKHFKLSTHLASLCGLSLVLGLYASPVHADFEFGSATNLGPGVNSPGFESAVGISSDGLSFYFVLFQSDANRDFWVTERASSEDPWNEALFLGSLNNIAAATVSIGFLPGVTTSDGLECYYSAIISSGYGNRDIYTMKRESIDSVWGPLVNLGAVVNTQYDESLACISPDGLELYFGGYTKENARPGGHGYSDLWVTRRATRDDPWTEPINLGPVINSPYTDARPSISPDGLLLFFDSSRPGGYGSMDLYMIRRASPSDEWGKPVNLGPHINTSEIEECARISSDGTTLFWDSPRPGGYGGNDLWQAQIEPIVDLTNDGNIDVEDLSVIVDHWQSADPLCDIGPIPMGDGVVDIQDLSVLSEYLKPGYGRIAHWKLDESEGAIALDSVGSFHSDIIGGPEWQPETGIVSGALQLDGVDDYLAPALVLNPQDGPFRITAWIQGGKPGQVIASQLPEGDTTYDFLYLAADPDDGSLMTNMVLPNMPLDSDIVITDGQWHEIGFEWDGAHRHLYVDGIEVVDEITLPAYAFDQSGWLDIGKGNQGQPDTYWSGLIDEVKVFKKGTKP